MRREVFRPILTLPSKIKWSVTEIEADHVTIPEASPREVLHFLMQQNGLTQTDLADCAPQSRISEILSGKHEISKEIANALATKFAVNVGVFV